MISLKHLEKSSPLVNVNLCVTKFWHNLNPYWKTAILAVGGWSVAALFTSTFIILQDHARRRYNPIATILIWQFATAFLWILLTPLILWLTKKFPLGEGSFRRNLPIHIFGGLLIILLRQALDAYIQPKLGFPPRREPMDYWQSFRFVFIVDFHWSVINYTTALGVIFGTRYYKKFREREFAASQLEAKLAQAQLHALKMQMHPHFLFNTHNAISELIYKDPEKAEQMLGNLSDLLRLSLDNVETQKFPLKKELEFLKKYLEIEEIRFQDRLQVVFDIEPETLSAVVPYMILQPLVENAIKHGIAPLARGGTIKISAARNAQLLKLQIADDGIGIPFGDVNEIVEGIGLSNTRSRLRCLYAENHEFEIIGNGGSGLIVNLTMPFQVFLSRNNGGEEKTLWKSEL